MTIDEHKERIRKLLEDTWVENLPDLATTVESLRNLSGIDDAHWGEVETAASDAAFEAVVGAFKSSLRHHWSEANRKASGAAGDAMTAAMDLIHKDEQTWSVADLSVARNVWNKLEAACARADDEIRRKK